VPLVVILALAFAALGGSSGGPDSTANPTSGALPPVSASAPPHAVAQAAGCAQVLAQLPVALGALPPRVVHTRPDSPYVVAWGDPPVVLRCGVNRPADLTPGSSVQFLAGGVDTGPFYDVTKSGSANVWTTVDRGPYISISVPAKYQGSAILPPLSQAIAKALPAVCTTDPNTPDPAKLCTRRR
jgi:hypothetical protein